MRPFEGIKIIDATHVLAGPFAAYQMAVLGAEVIKIDDPANMDQVREQGPDNELNSSGMGTYYLTQASNKRSMTLNLKSKMGRNILHKLIKSSDVFIENFRAGALTKIGLGYDELKKYNQNLIYCSMTAFGQEGPRSNQTAYDMQIQATSGLMCSTGTSDVNPIKVGPPVVDYATGSIAAFAIASALFQREKTKTGQYIDQSMFDVSMMLMAADVTNYLWSGIPPKPSGNDHPFSGGRCYETEDGLLMLGAMNRKQHQRLFLLIDEPEIATETDAVSRLQNSEYQSNLLSEILKSESSEYWENYFQDNHIPATKVRPLEDALNDPHLKNRGILHEFPNFLGTDQTLSVPIAAFKYNHDGPRIDSPPPQLGQHTKEILSEIGMDENEIKALQAQKVI
jgi:crotonobetainyl-CoA:carnitine CoA-transferase CaiB-like acyl-CoA transferase